MDADKYLCHFYNHPGYYVNGEAYVMAIIDYQYIVDEKERIPVYITKYVTWLDKRTNMYWIASQEYLDERTIKATYIGGMQKERVYAEKLEDVAMLFLLTLKGRAGNFSFGHNN